MGLPGLNTHKPNRPLQEGEIDSPEQYALMPAVLNLIFCKQDPQALNSVLPMVQSYSVFPIMGFPDYGFSQLWVFPIMGFPDYGLPDREWNIVILT